MLGFEKKNEKDVKSLADRFKLFFNCEFFKNRIVIWAISLSLFFNLANWFSIWYFVEPVDFPIILHYNVYFGVDMTGDWKKIFFLPGMGLLLFFINSFLAFYFFKKSEKIASYILLMAGLMVQISLIIASFSTILINY